MNQEQVTANAKQFAEVTHSARELTALMQSTAVVRIKNNSTSFYHLSEKVLTLPNSRLAAKMLGKEYEVKVKWGACGGVHKQYFCFMGFTDPSLSKTYLVLDEADMKAIFTQKGDAPKLFYLWKEIKSKQ